MGKVTYGSLEEFDRAMLEKSDMEQRMIEDETSSEEEEELDEDQFGKNEYTPSDVISMLGFGWAQFGTISVFVSTYFSQFLLVNMMAYFSTR